MISDRKFSNSYSSIWNELLPTADSFVRRINLLTNRFHPPIDSDLSTDRNQRAVINELAFRLFREKADGNKVSPDLLLELEENVRFYVEQLVPKMITIPKLSKHNLDEAENIADALASYFHEVDLAALIIWPQFRGCGQLDACKGDIIHGNKLIEVKAGDRHFRMPDIRQIITYLSLNFNSKQYDLTDVVLVNPRTGLEFECTIDVLIESCSGRKPVDVFSDIIEFFSAEIVSR